MKAEPLFLLAAIALTVGLVAGARSLWLAMLLVLGEPEPRRPAMMRSLVASLITCGLCLTVIAFLPLDAGRDTSGNGLRIPLGWVLMPWTAWGLVTSLLFVGVRGVQWAIGLRGAERSQRLRQGIVWACVALVFFWLHQTYGSPVEWYAGICVLKPSTALAMLVFLAAAIVAMAIASKRARGRGATKTAVTHFTLLAGSVVFSFPFIWLLSTSFKESRDIVSQFGEIRLMPRVEETLPYFDPANPLYEGVHEGNTVSGYKIGEEGDGRIRIDIANPVSMRGVTFSASLKQLKVIPKDAKVVTSTFDGVPVRGMVLEDFEDARRRIQILEPAKYKGVEFVANPSDVMPVMKPGLRWKNYPEALEYLPPETSMGLVYLKNTLFLVVMTVIGTIMSSAIVAYAFSRMRFPGKAALFTLMLSTMMLPGAVTLLPTFLIFRNLGWIDTLAPLWVPAFFAGAFNVFMLRQFFLTIPMELEDAAKIDGCSYWKTFWAVMLPQVKPALAVIAIWTFMATWNNFMGPLIYINSPENMPIAYAVQLFQSQRGGEPALLMAFATMAMVPVLLVFFFAQRYFIEGVTLSGLGGR
ncbi:MAG: hypothetical protein HONBIEJF_01854 [Fimbriimonadaceae bacterium]|nr:hypothetical protein [Fimbriimonadaceae bacterium]